MVASFYEPASEVAARLSEFSESDWRKALNWLHLSGLALYLLDRLTLLGVQDRLPGSILERLQKNLVENRKRTSVVFHETVALGDALEREKISFAVLKGITLSPESVPDIELRCQMDIDFLIRSQDARRARDVVLGFGYLLDSIKGREWIFTAGTDHVMSLESLYQVRPQRMVELHLLPAIGAGRSTVEQDLLGRARRRRFLDAELPCLSPADTLVQQALHIFKHICSERTRALWVLEFWRHVLARRGDPVFWTDVERIAAGEAQADVAIGAATLLATLLFGPFAPEELSRWTVDRLPPAVRLWIESYGRRILLSDNPASKFYLLLRRELQAGGAVKKISRWRFLLPFHSWPVQITRGKADERLPARLMRYRAEVWYAFSRLRFHIQAGLPYAIEAQRWQRRMARRR